ncbi:hypothetical protein EV44_g3768 [Erysiphe necator]|uniref:Uncharacterized protein n=1 Tax=Uncinula necator TaxID=52586 RepID=A0A0B1P5H0_UNCNE|nr:hypothetical protein EV44_g3768 [Erysiphe necator]
MQIKRSLRALCGDTSLKLLKFSGTGSGQCNALTARNMGTSQCIALQRSSVAIVPTYTILETVQENKIQDAVTVGKKHAAWDQRCPVKIAAKAKATLNCMQDPGKYGSTLETNGSDSEWQIFGSRKRRAGLTRFQIVGADGEIVERRGPGRPRKNILVPNMTAAAAKTTNTECMATPSIQENPRPVTRYNHTEVNGALECEMES